VDTFTAEPYLPLLTNIAKVVLPGALFAALCLLTRQGGNSSSGLSAAEDGSGAIWKGDLIVEVRPGPVSSSSSNSSIALLQCDPGRSSGR
jgi:hypothetical protein